MTKKLLTEEERKQRQKESHAKWRSRNVEKLRADSARWKAENKERDVARKALWQKNNKEKASIANKAWRDRNPEYTIEHNKKYYEENKEKLNKDCANYYAKNKDAIKERTKKYKTANKELYRVYHRNRRVKLKTSGKLSANIVYILYEKQNGLCACCNTELGNDFHIDHIMPVALGGLNTDDNVQLLTAKCNMKKHASHPDDYKKKTGNYND